MKVLVTGVAGFIGYHVARRLAETRKCEVLGVDSLNDYYEGPTGSNKFGYFDLGGILSVPLAFMNGKSTWEVHGGVDVLWLGDNAKFLNGGDGVKPVAVVGFSVIY